MFYKKNTVTSIDYIIVGLGNPGKKYEGTRHNAGFMAIDKIAEDFDVKVSKLKFKGITGQCRIGDKNILLLKPDTFMNLSGQSVIEAMNFYKLTCDRVLIIFDDISLEPGAMRIRKKGRDGGHNGMKNIIYLSGKDEFPRIKIGVGKKPHPDYDLADWVLSRFTGSEQKLINETAAKCTDAVKLIISGEIDRAMNIYN